MKSYLDILRKIIEEGKEKQPTRVDMKKNSTVLDNKTIGIPSIYWEHNMSDGFPIVTTRKIPIKSVLVELEGFLNGICDKKWYEDRKCNFWSYWNNPQIYEDNYDKKLYQKEDRDLGPLGYSHQWRRFNAQYKPVPTIHTDFSKEIVLDKSSKYQMVGKEFNSPSSGKFTVISSKRIGKEYKLVIKFHSTGYEMITSSRGIEYKNLVDPYFPTINNVACIGEIPENLKILRKKLYPTWKNMIQKCYDQNHKDYNNYGGAGIYVCNRWLIFSQFLQDIKKVTNWDKKEKEWTKYSLDKDMSEQMCYSLESCIFLTKKEQSKFTLQRRILAENTKENCFDQIKNIAEGLRENPSNRRFYCSAWNPNQRYFMALEPCHVGFNIVVYENKLNLIFIMRSSDVPIGLPSNIASYATLLLLFAKHSNLEPGKLSCTLGDAHIYSNQMDGVREQLQREPLPLPTVEIPDNSDDPSYPFDIFKWDHTQFNLLDYKFHPTIKMPVTV